MAPAMNTSMWQHPATQRNVEQLRRDGVHVVEPDAGEMACGTIGPGRLSEPERIVSAALAVLSGAESRKQDLAGEHLLITTGATREELDPVRFISNRSSGRMGFALAEAALARGAQVTTVAGITSVAPPSGIKVVRANSAAEMEEAVKREIQKASIFIGAAAVADYRPVQRAANKIKKTESTLSISLERTPDILGEVAASRTNGLLVIGFAAETNNVVSNAQAKLQAKKLDAVIANDVSRDDIGFDSNMNQVTIVTQNAAPMDLPSMSKLETAHCILDEIVRLRQSKMS
jgi:phosphopantothenoylcysteine decarboxylase/phosphopantothenate--cysteine ligase